MGPGIVAEMVLFGAGKSKVKTSNDGKPGSPFGYTRFEGFFRSRLPARNLEGPFERSPEKFQNYFDLAPPHFDRIILFAVDGFTRTLNKPRNRRSNPAGSFAGPDFRQGVDFHIRRFVRGDSSMARVVSVLKGCLADLRLMKDFFATRFIKRFDVILHRMRSGISVACVALMTFGFLSPCLSAIQSPASPSPVDTIQAEVIKVNTSFQTTEKQFAPVTASVNLGALPAGRDYEVHLFVRNESGGDVVFHRVDGICESAKMQLGGNVFPAGSTSELVLHLKTPTSQRSNDIPIWFRLLDGNGKDVAAIRVNATLAGNLALAAISTVLVVPESGLATLSIPVISSDLIRPEDLQPVLSDDLRDFTATLVRDDDGGMLLQVTLAGKMVLDGTSGTIQVNDPGSGKSTTMDLLVSKAQPITISPVLIRFREDQESTEHSVANVLIRINMPPAGDGGPPSGLERMTVKLGGEPVKVDLKELKNGIWSARLHVANSVLKTGEKQILWEFSFVGLAPVILETPVIGEDQ